MAAASLLAGESFSLVSLHPILSPARIPRANALGDQSVTVEQVTPQVYPSEVFLPSEERVVQLFEKNTYSVVNIFDVTLRPQINVTGMVEIPEGNGSGVVWDRQGHIVTNYHVIGNSLSKNPSRGQVVARVNILALDGVQKGFEGRLIGADRAKDLAVLKVEASEELLKPIKVGPSSLLKVGQQCLAIGNPFGFDHTLTAGVISGLNRDIFSQTGVTIGGGIQTDAAINPGNRNRDPSATTFRPKIATLPRGEKAEHHRKSYSLAATPSVPFRLEIATLLQGEKAEHHRKS